MLLRCTKNKFSDQFLAWLSEAESLVENTEVDADRNPLSLKVREIIMIDVNYFWRNMNMIRILLNPLGKSICIWPDFDQKNHGS
jgi:hypothetical protein